MKRDKEFFLIESIIDSAVKTSYDIKSNLIILFSDNIMTARIISKYRPACLVAYPTSSVYDVMDIRFIRGIIPVYNENGIHQDNILNFILMKSHTKTENEAKIVIINVYVEKHKKYKNGFHLKTVK
jgi:pyruvate kinase